MNLSDKGGPLGRPYRWSAWRPIGNSSRPPRPILIVAALLLAATLWSLNGPLIKLLYADGAGLSGLTIAFYCSAIGAILFVPWAWRHRRSLKETPLRARAASVLCFTVMTSTFIAATTMTAASSAIVLQYTAPMWVVLLSPLLLRERATRSELAVVTFAMGGVLVVFLGNPISDRVALAVALTSGVGYGTL